MGPSDRTGCCAAKRLRRPSVGPGTCPGEAIWARGRHWVRTHTKGRDRSCAKGPATSWRSAEMGCSREQRGGTSGKVASPGTCGLSAARCRGLISSDIGGWPPCGLVRRQTLLKATEVREIVKEKVKRTAMPQSPGRGGHRACCWPTSGQPPHPKDTRAGTTQASQDSWTWRPHRPRKGWSLGHMPLGL